MRRLLILWLTAMPAWAVAATVDDAIEPPAWAYAVSKPPSRIAEVPDAQVPQRVPGSTAEITRAQLRNLYQAPDWHPGTHGAMPAIVAQGRNPGVFACGYCHLPSGTGRPENANLTGLTVGYITQQMADFKSGVRKSSVAALPPQAMMVRNAVAATEAEAEEAARYFAALPVRSFVSVVETGTVPRTEPRGWMLVPVHYGGTEPIGARIVEVPQDVERTELRDPASGFTAYVPPGSLAAGLRLAASDARGPSCVSCHGTDLRGQGGIPRLAARSPSYLVRQLVDFRSGARAGRLSEPMAGVVKGLSLNDMIGLAAYAASLPP